MNGNLPRGCADMWPELAQTCERADAAFRKSRSREETKASGHSPGGDFGFLVSSFILHPSAERLLPLISDGALGDPSLDAGPRTHDEVNQ